MKESTMVACGSRFASITSAPLGCRNLPAPVDIYEQRARTHTTRCEERGRVEQMMRTHSLMKTSVLVSSHLRTHTHSGIDAEHSSGE
jgi:hypothetical protein